MSLRVAWLAFALAVAATAQEPAAALAPDPARLAASIGADPHAAAALLHLGADAVPPLLPYLSRKLEWPAKERSAAWDAALRLLLDLGPVAGSAVDTLIDALEQTDRSNQSAIFAALGAIAPWQERRAQIAATLGNRCDQGHYMGNPGFFATISRLSFDPNQNPSSLMLALSYSNGYVREFAAEALARKLTQERPDAAATKPLGKQLREALAAEVPTGFQLTWTWNGQNANTGGSFDGAEQVRSAIALALAAIEPNATESVPGHIRMLAHTDPVVRTNALRTLGGLGDAAASAVPAMARALRDRDPNVAHEAATMLGVLGPSAAAAKDDLIQASKSSDKQLAARAQAALRRIP